VTSTVCLPTSSDRVRMALEKVQECIRESALVLQASLGWCWPVQRRKVVELRVWQRLRELFTDVLRMDHVLAGNDARWYCDGADHVVGDANHRHVGTVQEELAPAFHHVDELSGI